MNISEALFYQSLSPEKLSDLFINIILGFEEAGIRKANYFDLFIIIPFYSYTPAQQSFKQIRFNPLSSFQNKIERNPDLYVNIVSRYIKSIEYIKGALLFAISKGIIEIDDELDLNLLKRYKVSNVEVKNISKVLSIRETSFLYNFFKVDVNVI